jgi:hypothetical protein
MSRRFLTSTSGLAVLIAVASLAPLPVTGQSGSSAAAAETWTLPRTADGQPDLQGVWDFSTLTPLERPRSLAGKEFFTDAEAASFEREESRRQNRDLINPKEGGLNYPPGGVVPYNEVWYERGTKVVKSKRTSLIVDPPDGRLPAMTPEGQRKRDQSAAEERETQLGHPRANSWEDRPLQERCLMGSNAGPPMHPAAYNNHFQLFQTPGSVAILTEMVHDARIIPTDGRPHGNLRQWKGDSVGRWDGNTLVVDTTNFKRETTLAGTSASTHLIERFARTDADTLLYEFTVDDPTMWTRPWTAAIPTWKSQEPIYEYACHEGNYAMAGILAGARADEKAAEKATGKAAR